MNSILILYLKFTFLINGCFSAVNINYSWLENNDLYDCVVGISVDGKPVSTGIIWKDNCVVTSANPIERINDFSRIKIHVIDGDFNRNKVLDIYAVTKDQARRLTGGQWKTFGFDDRHAPQHDISFITVMNKFDFTGKRYPKNCTGIWGGNDHFDDSSITLSYVGFGFIDRPHVKQNVELELAEYEYEDVFAECSEWIPVIWGNFICLLNVEHFVGVSSGGGLFIEDNFLGIGSFAVRKGNDGILLFTDLTKYEDALSFRSPAIN